MRLANRLSALLLASTLPLAACGGVTEPAECTAPEGTDYGYVASSITLPTTPNEAATIGLDIDGVLPRVDNALGMLLATLAGQANLDINGAVGDAISAGDVILLVNVTSEDLTNATCSGVSVYLGANPSVAPCTSPEDTVCGAHLDGSTSFEIAADSPRDTTLLGNIIGGKFALGLDNQPGNFALELNLLDGQAPITLDLIGARIEISSVTETGLSDGVLGGAVTRADLDTSVLPAVHAIVADIVTADCTGEFPTCCTESSPGALIVELFDDNDDCTVELAELTGNDLVSALLVPDLDLFDAEGNYNPNSDGIKESLSLGLRFSAVRAQFTAP